MNQTQRKATVQNVYQHVNKLHPNHRWYKKQIKRYIIDTIREDARVDRTTKKIVGKRERGVATIQVKEPGIISGIEEVVWATHELGIKAKRSTKDGASKKSGSVIMELHGNARILFAAERTFVNTLQRMSGISTFVHNLKQEITKYPVHLAATRKTLWLGLDKKAVAVGGGLTHRVALQDGIMVKNNHLDWLNDPQKIRSIHYAHRWPRVLEVRTPKEFRSLLQTEPEYNSILLDNFSPDQIRTSLRWAKQAKLYNHFLFEASGGITSDNVLHYAKTGVDVISMGALTHSAPALDISMTIHPA